MTVRRFNWMIIMAASSTLLNTHQVFAQERSITESQPDEAFLEFLASMAEVDGEVTDPLDMLELSDEPALDESEISTDHPDADDLESSKVKMKSDFKAKPKSGNLSEINTMIAAKEDK